jgi:hypothetical protein
MSLPNNAEDRQMKMSTISISHPMMSSGLIYMVISKLLFSGTISGTTADQLQQYHLE